MTLLIPLLIGAVLGGLLGMCAGWLARGRGEPVEKIVTREVVVEKIVERASDDVLHKRDQATEILSQLQLLTSGVTARIDEHSKTVGDINNELTAAGQGEASTVVSAIRRLVDSNRTMQSQLHDAKSQLEHQANLLEVQQEEARTDPLTKLGNRRAFDDELSQRWAKCAEDGSQLALMMIDVDHFKKCNDTYGHLAGDDVLRMVGRVLTEGAKEQAGVFPARYGGEEFALLISGHTLEAAAEIGNRIRQRIEATPVTVDGQTLTVTASAGVAGRGNEDSTLPLVARADEALYAAKRSGRNCTCFHQDGTIHKLLAARVGERPNSTGPAHVIDLDSNSAMEKAINRRIAEWRRGGQKLSLIVGRIDNLAAMEAQGIRWRDRAMLQTGEYLKQTLREMDQVALLSGEIFGMLLPTALLADAVRIAERMRSGIQEGVLTEMLGPQATISFGVAEISADDDGEALILRARRAMEAARRRGGNAVYVNDGVYSTAAQDVLDIAADAAVSAS